MARGKKYNEDLKERARALLSVNNSVEEVAKTLNLPRSTVDTWRKKFENDENNEKNLVILRQKKKEGFINSAWRTIENAQKILERRTRRALDDEEKLDTLIDELRICVLAGNIPKEIVMRFLELKLDDIGRLSTVIGTLYDKQALAAKEPTEILGGEIGLRKFEDFE